MTQKLLPLLQTPLKAVWNVAGNLTDTCYWPSANAGKKIVLMLIPGNPGLVDYYDNFCEVIHKNLADNSDLSLEIIAGKYLVSLSLTMYLVL